METMVFHAITRAFAAGPQVLGTGFVKDLWEATVAMYPEGPAPCHGRATWPKSTAHSSGPGAYKSAPVSGEVEIAYFTFPEHEGRGVATRMARHLIELAARHGVATIKAQTLPQPNASTRVLQKLGFAFHGAVTHPEDGEVGEWRK